MCLCICMSVCDFYVSKASINPHNTPPRGCRTHSLSYLNFPPFFGNSISTKTREQQRQNKWIKFISWSFLDSYFLHSFWFFWSEIFETSIHKSFVLHLLTIWICMCVLLIPNSYFEVEKQVLNVAINASWYTIYKLLLLEKIFKWISCNLSF